MDIERGDASSINDDFDTTQDASTTAADPSGGGSLSGDTLGKSNTGDVLSLVPLPHSLLVSVHQAVAKLQSLLSPPPSLILPQHKLVRETFGRRCALTACTP